VAWSSQAPAIAEVDGAGTVTGLAAGVAQIVASAGGVSGMAIVSVGTSSLRVLTVAPELLRPGATATLDGSGFASTPAGNAVTVAGVAAAVLTATPTRLTVRLPGADAFACRPRETALIEVRAGGATGAAGHPLEVATRRELAVGELVRIAPGSGVRCQELPAAGARYVLSVANTGSAAGNVGFQLSGAAPAAPAATLSAAVAAPPPTASVAAGDDLHHRILDANRELVARLGRPVRPATGPEPGILAAVAASLPQPGDSLPVRVANVRATSNYCNDFQEIRARVVHVGSRSVVLEHGTPVAISQQADSVYRAVGREFDEQMFGVLTEHFGNPFALRTNQTGARVYMVFTRAVNDFGGGLQGFVFSGDLYPRSACAASNDAEIFYGVIPTGQGTGSTSTAAEWHRRIRGTVVHEVKHIVSNVERLSRNGMLEESWLEEGSARMAEEIWARGQAGFGRANTGYDEALRCEFATTAAGCAGKPFVMTDIFAWLYRYLTQNETSSPVAPVTVDDGTPYGSAWLLLRWALDHSGQSEAAFLRALTQDAGRSGLQNLQARTGRPWAEMLAEWSLALALDDRPGFAGPAALTVPSWNLRDVFAGLNRDRPGFFSRTYPLAPRAVAGSFNPVTVPALRGGTAALFELHAGPVGGQLVELTSSAAGAPSANLQLALVRVQ
jgi:hypothetical protein